MFYLRNITNTILISLDFRKCRNYPTENTNDEVKNNTIVQNDLTKMEKSLKNDSDWMNAIKAEAKLGRQLVLQSLVEHPYIGKEIMSKQVLVFHIS